MDRSKSAESSYTAGGHRGAGTEEGPEACALGRYKQVTTNSEEASADAQQPGLSTLNMPRLRGSGNLRNHARANIHHWISNLMPATLRPSRKAATRANHDQPSQHRLLYGRSSHSKAEMCARLHICKVLQGFLRPNAEKQPGHTVFLLGRIYSLIDMSARSSIIPRPSKSQIE